VRIAALAWAGAVLCARPGIALPVDTCLDSWAARVIGSPFLAEKTVLLPFSIAYAATLTPAHGSGMTSRQAPVIGVVDSGGDKRPSELQNGKQHVFDYVMLLGAMIAGLMVPLWRRRYSQMKRLFDVVGSTMALSFLFPLMACIALLVKLDSPGPVLFKQVRVGVNRRRTTMTSRARGERRGSENLGSLFSIYKFRTMCVNAESTTGPVWARENDDRVTRVGRVLRKTHLDELPQFINVLKGDMCIIGPRPERPVFINRLKDCLPAYARRLEIKPGITGLAQVRYRYAASIQDAKIKLRYDLVYRQKMCFILDLGILLNTFNIMVSTKGAR
jgi:lipopolysaccharide/colanic/teichoic acid biosynthesis glycosyltransferase